MEPAVFVLPFHRGQRREGMGQGPERIAALAGLRAEVVEAAPIGGEVARVADVNDALAKRARGTRPLVLAGDCNSALGTLAGLGKPASVVWFDAHGDFNTPATSPSGYLDGMALAALAGRCQDALWRGRLGLPVPAQRMVHAAGRAWDPGEREAFVAAGGTVVGPDLGGLEAAVARLPDPLYLHVDVDALDASEGRPNRYAAPGGPSLPQLEQALRSIADRHAVAAAAVTAYDPAEDADGRAGRAGARLARLLSEALGDARRPSGY